MKRIQSKFHRTGTNQVCKVCFSYFDDKLYTLDNGINSLAYFHKDIFRLSQEKFYFLINSNNSLCMLFLFLFLPNSFVSYILAALSSFILLFIIIFILFIFSVFSNSSIDFFYIFYHISGIIFLISQFFFISKIHII